MVFSNIPVIVASGDTLTITIGIGGAGGTTGTNGELGNQALLPIVAAF